MGWQLDGHEDEHEGWVVAVERRGDGWLRWCEILMDDYDHEVPVGHVQVGCECGWRSPRLVAPLGTFWAPCSVFLSIEFEDAARELWRRLHVDLLPTTPRSLYRAWSPLPAVGPSAVGALGTVRDRQLDRRRAVRNGRGDVG